MVNAREYYLQVWRTFVSLEETIPTEKRDYEAWRRGRREYAVWSININSRAVQSRFEAAKAHLSDFLLQPYDRQMHVTLFVCGFLVDDARWDDDYPLSILERHLREVKDQRQGRFQMEIGGINSFATTPFLEVFDPAGGIKNIRRVLSRSHPEIRQMPYVPHLTLGLYAGRFSSQRVAEHMASFPPGPRIAYSVEEVVLSTYSASEVAGPLKQKQRVRLS